MKLRNWLIILAVVIINLAIIFLVSVHSQRKAASESRSKAKAQLSQFGVDPQISAAQFQDATNSLVEERQMWSRFNGLHAQIQVELEASDGKMHALSGDVVLRKINLFAWEMTLSGTDGKWSVKANGNPTNTVVTCADKDVLEVLQRIEPSTLCQMLAFPPCCVLPMYDGAEKLYPEKRKVPTFDRMLKVWRVALPANGRAVPHSYSFVALGDSSHLLELEDGHLSRRQNANLDEQGNRVVVADAVFEKPILSHGVWYPSVLEISPAPTPWPYPHLISHHSVHCRRDFPGAGKGGHLRIRLSELVVTAG